MAAVFGSDSRRPTDKSALRDRLGALVAVEDVFPTRRTRDRPPELQEAAEAAAVGDVGAVRDLSFAVARRSVHDDVEVRDDGVSRLIEAGTAHEHVAAFVRAGFNFFTAGPGYGQRSLVERSAAGGNGVVTRVLAGRETVLLETQRIVVGFAAGVAEEVVVAVLERYGLVEVRRFTYVRDARQVVTQSGTAVDVSLRLMDEDVVEYAEPDFIEYVGTRAVPEDPLVAQQWHHAVLGLGAVWPDVTGEGARIAVVDNGFDTAHPDLVFADPGSAWFRGSPDADDAVLVPAAAAMPAHPHGTACAGMAAAAANGAAGVGVAFGAVLHGVACIGDQVGTQTTLARAIAYAAQPATEGVDAPGADVIACSLGPNTARWEMRPLLSDAVDFVATVKDGRGVPLFWAVTNGNYPISHDEVCSHPGTIAVGRSTSDDTDDGSGFGPELDFLAPGVDVLLPVDGGGYAATTGTSFACPCAAGVAALLLAKNPGLSAAEVRAAMRASCRPIGDMPYVGGRNDVFGFGRVDAEATLAAVP